MTVRIRKVEERDEARWRELFDGYTRWARLYWNTKENNYRARALYDTYTPHSGFIRYVISPG
jgi:hypothetical protein